jgi:hypothetical protein
VEHGSTLNYDYISKATSQKDVTAIVVITKEFYRQNKSNIDEAAIDKSIDVFRSFQLLNLSHLAAWNSHGIRTNLFREGRLPSPTYDIKLYSWHGG